MKPKASSVTVSIRSKISSLIKMSSSGDEAVMENVLHS